MAIKKTDLYSSLWASCDALRGGMDASQYKDYVLTLLFMKYVSDKYKGDPHGMIIVPEGASYDDMVALKGDKEIGEGINKVIGSLAEANNLKGVIDVADFNNEDMLGKGKDMVDRLTELVSVFEGLDLGANQADGDDLLGDAYEYLMRHFATESGKSKGQFYTPSEVSQVLAKVLQIPASALPSTSVYDPTCGSGSLLLKASDEADKGLSIFGQEMDNATSALARMNMILHDKPTAEIYNGNVLSDPHWKETNGMLKRFDYVVANPPFSTKNWTSGLVPEEDEFNRFHFGVPPEKNGDYAFFMHVLASLKSTGKAAIILPHGVLFRGNAEARIRENIIKNGYIKGIIGFPANLFYGTGIPACVLVVDKENAQARKGIFMIDASQGFIKDGNKNRLRSQDIHKIVSTFNQQLELDGYSRMVSMAEVADNEYNLNIPRYIDSSEPEDLHDLTAHLKGGIPNADIDALSDYWQVFPNLRQTLFAPAQTGYSQALVEPADVKSTVLNHPEFVAFAKQALEPFEQWFAEHKFDELVEGETPKAFIHRISESLLSAYAQVPLLDKYNVYQLLMNYWADTLQDDMYQLKQEGWQMAKQLRTLLPTKDKKGKNVYREAHDFEYKKVRYVADLIPPALMQRYFYAEDLRAIEQLQSELDACVQEKEALIEEHSGEDGLLAEATNDSGNITATTLRARLRETTDDEELTVLEQLNQLFRSETAAKRAMKEAQDALNLKVFNHYPALSEAEIKTLVVEHKWHADLHNALKAEIERVTQQLANRVKELEERYAEPLPQITEQVEALSSKVAEHLKAMGLAL